MSIRTRAVLRGSWDIQVVNNVRFYFLLTSYTTDHFSCFILKMRVLSYILVALAVPALAHPGKDLERREVEDPLQGPIKYPFVAIAQWITDTYIDPTSTGVYLVSEGPYTACLPPFPPHPTEKLIFTTVLTAPVTGTGRVLLPNDKISVYTTSELHH
jgi:hypothetical protein